MELAAEIATLNTKIQQLQREANNEDLTRDVAKGRSEIVRLKGEIVDLESKFRCWYKRAFDQSIVLESLRADIETLQADLHECAQKLKIETARADKAEARSSKVLEAGRNVQAEYKRETERWGLVESECLVAQKELAKEIEKRKLAESRCLVARAEPKPYVAILESTVAGLRSDLARQTSSEVAAQEALQKALVTAEKRRTGLNKVQGDLNDTSATLALRDKSIRTLIAANKGLRARLPM